MNRLKQTQNFLIDPSIATKMIQQAQITPGDLVIDIGAGKGALTRPLSQAAKKVLAVELDKRLAGSLKKIYRNHNVVKVLPLNFLNMPLPRRPFKVVSSIPYNITTDIFGKLFDHPNTSFKAGTILMEWGAAKRFTSPTADPRIIGWNTWSEIRIIQPVSSRMFQPAPSVDSAMVRISRRTNPLVNPGKYYGYQAFVSSLLLFPQLSVKKSLSRIFTRKQVHRVCCDGNIQQNAAIGTLTVEQWAQCFNTMDRLVPKRIHPAMPGKFKKYYDRHY